MKIRDRITDEQKKQLSNISNKTYSRREIEDLMDMRKPTYKRHRGAVRRK